MSNFQKIKVDGVEYYIVDSIQNLRAEDSFIVPKNKLEINTGAGEARKYVGSYLRSNGQRLSSFFEYDKWGREMWMENAFIQLFKSNVFLVKRIY